MKTKHLKILEKYYNGEMEPSEKAAFEKSLTLDPELNADYQEYLSIYEAIGDTETLDLLNKLKELREEKYRGNNGSDFILRNRNWIWLAALITVIISFSVIASLLTRKVDWKEQTAKGTSAIEVYDYNGLNRELMKFTQRKSDFKLESPSDSVYHDRKEPILFIWTVNTTNPLVLDLIDWEGKIVFSSGKPVTSPYIVKKKFKEGVLAYRFRTDTESYCLGFLFLK